MTAAAEARRLAAELRAEAHRLLEDLDALALLDRRFGSAAIVGSVDLDLMIWRDIDLYVAAEPEAGAAFLGTAPLLYERAEAAGHRIVSISFNDEYRRPNSPYGHGLYCGFRLLTAQERLWKLDLWGWASNDYPRKVEEHPDLHRRMEKADRDRVLELKSAVQGLPGYRDWMTSYDVYRFVLGERAGGVAEFQAFCRAGRSRDGHEPIGEERRASPG